jgi:hypothetical protein
MAEGEGGKIDQSKKEREEKMKAKVCEHKNTVGLIPGR